MLYRLEIANFYSMRDPQIIDLRVAPNVVDPDSRFAPIYPGAVDRVPKTIALFGANASGKSTILRALSFVAWFVQNSFGLQPVRDDASAGGWQPCERFWSEDAANFPTRLSAQFTGPRDLTGSVGLDSDYCRYEYEVQFESRAGKPRRVVLERLRQAPGQAGKWIRVFDRDEHGLVQGGKSFALGGYSKVIDKVRNNASVVSTLAQFNHAPSLTLHNAASRVFTNILGQKMEVSDADVVRQGYAVDPTLLDALNRDIARIDLGISGASIQQRPDGAELVFEHRGLAAAVPMHLESHGTRQFVRVFPLIANALTEGGVAVIDELDQTIHPLLLPEIVRWFRAPQRNPHNAQLWMSCHSATLLDDLEKEEVYFCEKDMQGRTTVHGLRDIQAVRRHDNHYGKYLGGVYGAVPRIG